MTFKSFILLSIIISLILVSFIYEFKFLDYSISPINGNWQNVDQYIEIPTSYFLSGAKLFQKDFAVSEFAKIYPSFLFPLMGFLFSLTKNMLFNYVIIFIFLKSIYVFFSYKLSKLLLKKESLALLATLFLSFSHFIGPDEIGLIEIVPKDFVFAFIPLIFYLFFKDPKKYYIPIFIALGVLVYFHSISIIPIALIFLFSILFIKKDYKMFLVSVVIFSIVFLPYFKSNFLEKKPFNLNDLSYVVLWYKLPDAIKTTGKFFIVILAGLFVMKKENKEIFYWSILLILYSSLTALGPYNDTIFVIGFFRAMKFVIFFSFIFSTILISRLYKRSKLISVILALVLFIPFSSIYYSNIFGGLTKSPSPYLMEINNAKNVSTWLRENTDTNALILIPPDWGSLRPWSERAVVISNIDAHISSLNKEVTVPIRERFTSVTDAYTQDTSDAILSVASKYGANYVVTYKKDLSLPELYSSGNFKVYRYLKNVL